jgi:hypothetical protein
MADETSREREPRSPAQIARDAAVEQTAATLAYIGITVLVSVAILKRDALWRLWRRVTVRPTPPEAAAVMVAMAEVRRDISRMEHEREARPPRPLGLYESWGRPS